MGARRTRLLLLVLAVQVSLGGPASAQEQAEPGPGAATAPVEADPLSDEADALWSGIQARRTQVAALQRQIRGLAGEDLLVLEEKIWSKQLQSLAITRELVQNVLAQEAKQLDASEVRSRVSAFFVQGVSGFDRHFVWRDGRVAALRKRREGVEGSDRVALETLLTAEQDRFQLALSEFALTIGAMEQLGLDAIGAHDELESRLVERA